MRRRDRDHHACLADPQRAEFAIVLAVLIWFRHGPNIRRLIRGEEVKIGS